MKVHLRAALAAAGAASCLVLAACGADDEAKEPSTSSSPRSVTIDGRAYEVAEPLRLGVFIAQGGNGYATALLKSFKDSVADIPDATVTTFDGRSDATKQLNQLENAIESGKYNAISIGAVDPQLECELIGKRAPAAGILVITELLPACGRAANSGEALHTPGTLAFVGGPFLHDFFRDYVDWIVAQNRGPQKVLVLSAPPINPIAKNLNKALDEVTAEHPEFRVVGRADTDFSIAQGNAKTAALVQAHPDATILIAPLSDLATGAVAALKSAGKQGKLKLYDVGGNGWDRQALASGDLTATAPALPATAATAIVQAFVDARAGKRVPHVILNDGAPMPKGAPPSGLVVVGKDDTFEPEF